VNSPRARDRTHDSAKDEKRDAMLREAGYAIVRWHSKSKPNSTAIREKLLLPLGVALAVRT
jgi:very-short-patch-repair endonuclease